MSEESISPALLALGWSTSRAREAESRLGASRLAARVIAQHRDRYVVGTEHGDTSAILPGRSRVQSTSAIDRPAVGDWVAVRASSAELEVIEAILPRSSAFVRQIAGDTTQAQVVAANIDVALIATSVNGDLNPRRLERYVTLAWESGAMPVVLLTKADLAESDEVAAARCTVASVAPGVEVVAISTLEGTGLDELTPLLRPGQTAVLVGSSGVGKSTLVNALLDETRLRTHDVRDDGKGRHTTTHRELVRLASGALLIDTPGMRELQLWSDGSGVAAAFSDVEALAEHCRFRDCAHMTEPDCAVLAALESGELDAARLESYRALMREVAWLERRTDALASAEARRQVRVIHRAIQRVDDPKRR
ncbi:MAG: ribosome small subunit-dependent GTPase A [bacterium]